MLKMKESMQDMLLAEMRKKVLVFIRALCFFTDWRPSGIDYANNYLHNQSDEVIPGLVCFT